MRAWAQFDHRDLHRRLCEVALSDRFKEQQSGAQALFCPYYVPLEGKLGADWGVIVNPDSTRFGLLTFEHDDCGCQPSPAEDEEGWGRHQGAPSQDGDMWWDGWSHTCMRGWCDSPCEITEMSRGVV